MVKWAAASTPAKVGMLDRYQDLAVLWNCLGEFVESLQNRLIEQYGVAEADERRVS